MVKKARKPHRFKKRKPIYYNRFFWLAVLILILFSSFLYFFLFSGFFNIKEVRVSGLSQNKQEKVVLLVQENIKKDILFFSFENIFLVNLNKIKEKIFSQFPEIVEAKIERHFSKGLNISVKEREKLALFCAIDQDVVEQENCFYLDEEGIIFEETNDKNSLIKIKDKTNSAQFILGEKIIEKQYLALILKINSQLEQSLNISVKENILLQEKLIILTNQQWEIYFNLEEDIEWQLIKLMVLLDEKISEEERNNLEYIELRFGNFANPRYKD